MARLKRSSTVLETARQRLSGLKTITPKPNFGPALDLDEYEEEIKALSASFDEYNDLLSRLDGLNNNIDGGEAQLREKNRHMLAATEAHYGPDSNEYETAGHAPSGGLAALLPIPSRRPQRRDSSQASEDLDNRGAVLSAEA